MENKSIWHGNPTLKDVEWMKKNTLGAHLGIELKEIGNDFLYATMPVDERTRQPFGICHGGAYVALAEEIGSIASWLVLDRDYFIGLGMEINANHLKVIHSGFVHARCTPIHVKGRTHVWEIKMSDDDGELCSVSRFTVAVVGKNKV